MMFSRVPHALALALLLAGGAQAQDAAPRAIEQRLHEEMQAVLLRLIEAGELKAEDAEELALVAPASQQADFGAILDVRYRADADRGLPVLGVTPGGSAALIGLRAGDVLLAVNDQSLQGLGGDAQGRTLAAQRLREELLASSDAVRLKVARADAELTLSGPVPVVSLPAYRLQLGAALAQASLAVNLAGDGVSECGRISVFDIAPRRQKLYRAILIAIDGQNPGPTHSDSYRVAPGRHTLTVAEAIDSHQFSSLKNFERGQRGRERYKELVIDVQPGITYRLAARLNPDKRQEVQDGGYWDPTIWKEWPETCR